MSRFLLLGMLAWSITAPAIAAEDPPLPRTADGWKIELVARAPQILFPTACVSAPDGTVYLGQDPMDMPGPPTQPIDSIVAMKGDRFTIFADKLWSVMGLEWIEGTLYVVHAPFLSAFRDTNGDGKADSRVDLITGLGPKLPGFNGINDHVASGIRLGMDGYLYISVGDKGIPRGVGIDGTVIELFGGGVIRIRPDGTGLEVVSSGERNPLSVALTATDEIFTYGNDDDSKKWPNSLTHHIVGGHYGYPYDFLLAPSRALPVVAGQIGGSGAQGICYNEDGLSPAFRGNLFFCDWGLATVSRYEVERSGGTFVLKKTTPIVTKGELADFRPFSLAVASDRASLWLVDWAFDGWLADGPQTGRLYRLRYVGPERAQPAPEPTSNELSALLAALDHPGLSIRLASQRKVAALGARAVPQLAERLMKSEPRSGRLHSLWALDAIGTAPARDAIRSALADPDAEVRLQAARCSGIRADRGSLPRLTGLLRDRDAAVRREAAIALGKLGDVRASVALMGALGDPDRFAAWSIRHAIRLLKDWDERALVTALLDERRRDDALALCDEAWSATVVDALVSALGKTESAPVRSRIVATLAGLYRTYPPWSGHWFGTNPLAGRLRQKTADWDLTAMAAVLAGLATGLADRDSSVRLQAIAGMLAIGSPAAPYLRSRLAIEDDTNNLIALTRAVGAVKDPLASPVLAQLVQDANRPEPVRAAALDALGMLGGPQVLRARLALVYDPKAPASLVARALPGLGQEGVLPPNDVAGFFENPSPEVRSAALEAVNGTRPVPAEVRRAMIDRLSDSSHMVRAAAIATAARLKLHEAVPRLLAVANEEEFHTEAVLALASLPDPQALPLYLAAIEDRNPDLRGAGEQALLAIRERVSADLEKRLHSGRLNAPAARALERVLAHFVPIVDWRVIGPFPRTTARIFVGESPIHFDRSYTGAEGRILEWTERKADPVTGRVNLNHFKAGMGDRGGFGYDTNGSPNLCGFGYAEIASDRDRPALLLVGSSGRVTVSLNEKVVHHYDNLAGRAYTPDSDLVRVDLKKGTNRVLVVTRQGIGVWSFSVQVSDPSSTLLDAGPAASTPERLGEFALTHDGDPRAGEALFFDARGIGCVKCHSAGGRGTASVGPDLTGLALKYDKAEIIRSVVEPSNRLATGYQPILLAMVDGSVVTGLVRTETDAFIELVDAEGKTTRVPKSEVEERRVGDVSLMPKGQVDTLSPVQFADLISYLRSLKLAR